MVPDPPSRGDAELQQSLMRGDFRGDDFRRINAAPFASALHAGDYVNVYISALAADDYRLVQPDRLGPAPPIPVGTLIVREIVDGDGNVTKLTVMSKRDPHSFDGGGDFMFAVTTPDGTPMTADDGTVQWGSLETCGSCHATRQQSSWLFGVPADDRE